MKKTCSLIILSLLLSGCWETSKGVKLGVLVKCAREGFLIKTYECELIRGGMNNGSGSFGQSFHFTVEDEGLIHTAEQALNDQKEIKLSYHQEWMSLWRTETSSNMFADNIEVVK